MEIIVLLRSYLSTLTQMMLSYGAVLIFVINNLNNSELELIVHFSVYMVLIILSSIMIFISITTNIKIISCGQ